VTGLEGAVTFVGLVILSCPAVAVLTTKAVPMLVNVVRVELVDENPVEPVQAPKAVVQAWAEKDLTAVAEGEVKVNLYWVFAFAAAFEELLIVNVRAVICDAETGLATKLVDSKAASPIQLATFLISTE
jgi:hypothetical protein